MGSSKSRYEKRDRWSIVIPNGNSGINSVQLDTPDGRQATVTWENETSKTDSAGQRETSKKSIPQAVVQPVTPVIQQAHSTSEAPITNLRQQSSPVQLVSNPIQNGGHQLPEYTAQNPLNTPIVPLNRVTYVRNPRPIAQDLLLAACIFSKAAVASGIEFAIIGGVSAQIYGGTRSTKTLDILITPRKVDEKYLVRPVIDDLFDNNLHVLAYTGSNRAGHIVITHENVGIAINFTSSVDNGYHFPPLVAETRPDGTPWGHDDPEPTWSHKYFQPAGTATAISIPILLPRLLLEQRVLHFTREGESDALSRKKNDVCDIMVYLASLYGSEHQSFTNEEAQILLPKVREILRFADLYFIQVGLEVAKWRWINIPLVEGDWRT